MAISTDFSLNQKYTLDEGKIILSGAQALVRIPLDQHKADKKAGLNTATFISGYRGSPLGGFDMLLQRNKKLLKEHEVVFVPGVNEDLGATAVMGSQTANLLPQPKYDGVLGIWYGKGPGVDRSGDIFKHAQTTGVGKNGGVLALAGDDPTAKSSTIPSHSEIALYDAQMPILYPGNAQEVIEMGRYGLEMSRYSGSWVGMKFVTNVADEFSTATIRPIDIVKPELYYQGRPWAPTQTTALLAPYSLDQEREIYEGRLTAAEAFTQANSLNQIVVETADDWFGIVCAGKTYYDVREAFLTLGYRDADLNRLGIRLLKLGCIYPLEQEIIKRFARGLEKIFVIEEKRSFFEMQLRDLLYNEPERPLVVGKREIDGSFLVRGDYELDADQIVLLIADQLSKKLSEETLQIGNRLDHLRAPAKSISLNLAGDAMPARTPYFCSGCPHNSSTLAPEGSLQGGGIGCSTLSILMERNVTGVTQMGGEGAQWIGASFFTDIPHLIQHIGDGTLFHSGSMAIRQALAAETNITYKILVNGTVAMTGGQKADGEMPIPELTRALHAEGAKKIIVCTHDLSLYPSSTRWAPGVDLWHRDRVIEAQEVLRDIPGVTILIYDQPCATELRRQRKRGLIDNPNKRVLINEAVCEGCGDCGEKSNCLSVFPVETEYGRKTQIHQSSCNKDYSCLKGDCPAFLTVFPDDEIDRQKVAPQQINAHLDRLENLPEPKRLPPTSGNVYMTGIGGTGVVTINQILSTAALLDGKQVNSLDQTGLSQKGGPVVSHLKVSAEPREMANMIGNGAADAYIVFDLLSGTTDKNLKRARPGETVAVVSSSKIPTGTMIRKKEIPYPEGLALKHRLELVTKADENIYFDAIKTSEQLFNNHMPANIMTIGAAFQAGILPISALAIEHAIQLNGVAVEMNKRAFRVGRLIASDPAWLESLDVQTESEQPIAQSELTPAARQMIETLGAEGELKRLLDIRVPELIAYQDANYAQKYINLLRKVVEKDADLGFGRDGRLSQAVARYLFKLMAYKDEYEVARLQVRPEFLAQIGEQFGESTHYRFMLHPPILRALGWQKKIGFGRWTVPFFRLLASLKWLRGGPFDIFGRAEVRRVERELIDEYKGLITNRLATLSAANYDTAVQIAELPDMIRGYEEIKLANVEKFRGEVSKLVSLVEA